MKKPVFLLFIAGLVAISTVNTACSRKSGCPAYESAKAPVNRKGELSTKPGKSSLFPPGMQKKRKR